MPRGSVAIWLSPSSPGSRETKEACVALLHHDERRRWRRFLSSEAADQYLVARALLRTTLSRYWPVAPEAWRFDVTEHGKPFIADPSGLALGFNLSHTRGLVACAIHATQQVGIDVETVDPRVDHRSLAALVLTHRERARLEAMPEADRADTFFRYWTLKEAFIKAHGSGLSMPLQSFAYDLDADPPVITRWPATVDGGWHFREYEPMPGYRLALAVRLAENEVPSCTVSWVALETLAS